MKLEYTSNWYYIFMNCKCFTNLDLATSLPVQWLISRKWKPLACFNSCQEKHKKSRWNALKVCWVWNYISKHEDVNVARENGKATFLSKDQIKARHIFILQWLSKVWKGYLISPFHTFLHIETMHFYGKEHFYQYLLLTTVHTYFQFSRFIQNHWYKYF